MTLYPDQQKEMRISWLLLAAITIIGPLILWLVFSGEGVDSKKLKTLERTYKQRQSASPDVLRDQIVRQQEANRQLLANIEDVKKAVGIKKVAPYVVPNVSPYRNDPGSYFNKIYSAIKGELNRMAEGNRLVSYDAKLGYNTEQKSLSKDIVAGELVRLQLITKAVFLALSADKNIQVEQITHGEIIETGPESRLPLLREYPFRLELRGELKELSWVLHQLEVQQPDEKFIRALGSFQQSIQSKARLEMSDYTAEDHFPLIVRGWSIENDGKKKGDEFTQLKVILDLAGMEFLEPEERGMATHSTSAQPTYGSQGMNAPARSSRRGR